MRIPISRLPLSGLLVSSIIFGQQIRNDSSEADISADLLPPDRSADGGLHADGSSLEFFRILGGVFHTQEIPLTLDEAVEVSTVVARGKFSGVIPGRSLTPLPAPPNSPTFDTIFLKFVPSNVLKGDREDYFLIEYPASHSLIGELNSLLYSSDVLLFLYPATGYFATPRISLSPEAQAEWAGNKPLYQLASQSLLFVLTGTSRLTSVLDASPSFTDLYADLHSLEELESRIAAIRAIQSDRDDQVRGGSRQWGENSQPDIPDLQGLVQYRYEGGQLQAEINYSSGVPTGPARYWFQNGQLAVEAIFQAGQRVQCQAWTRDGTPTDCPVAGAPGLWSSPAVP